ncbi:SRPBCC domain-containing protein [Arthrobacter sp. AETb3-4]|uniref:SRPBCC domain-containing protein n=2 Tax=Arthrobacter wenxiniae TaxID=2713570 RepID=A0A7Y7IEB4_9MICC|nr:SRPBCC domain-containing protein [Arthrobacter wenxiniae]
MAKEFKIVHESEIDGTPQQVFDAATVGNSGWLWPMDGEFEPRVGGAGPYGSTVTAWDPPHRFANHVDGEGGFFNSLEYDISERPEGRSWLRYVHSGVFFEDWDNQYDGAAKHTAFYQHTLGQYVKYFAGKQAAFADIQGPEASKGPDAFKAVKAALGIHGAGAGGHVNVAIAGVGDVDAVVDYQDENFVGLRTGDAMYRFFGRNAFGAVVGMTVHLFAGGADGDAAGAAWGAWLNGLYS